MTLSKAAIAVLTEGSLNPASSSATGRRRCGRPGRRHHLAWSGAVPVVGAALFVPGDVGWLGIASTLPAARRRGAPSALMARRIDDGRALGCRWFVTETGEDTPARPNPSYRNMIRAGFMLAYDRQNFMPAV